MFLSSSYSPGQGLHGLLFLLGFFSLLVFPLFCFIFLLSLFCHSCIIHIVSRCTCLHQGWGDGRSLCLTRYNSHCARTLWYVLCSCVFDGWGMWPTCLSQSQFMIREVFYFLVRGWPPTLSSPPPAAGLQLQQEVPRSWELQCGMEKAIKHSNDFLVLLLLFLHLLLLVFIFQPLSFCECESCCSSCSRGISCQGSSCGSMSVKRTACQRGCVWVRCCWCQQRGAHQVDGETKEHRQRTHCLRQPGPTEFASTQPDVFARWECAKHSDCNNGGTWHHSSLALWRQVFSHWLPDRSMN